MTLTEIKTVEELKAFLNTQADYFHSTDRELWYLISSRIRTIENENTEITDFELSESDHPQYGRVLECTLHWNYYDPGNFFMNEHGIEDKFIVEML